MTVVVYREHKIDGSETLVTQHSYTSYLGTLIGSCIVARVTLGPDTRRSDSGKIRGEYAAYLGAGPNVEYDLVEYVARHGNKIQPELAEFLFRLSLDYHWPEYEITWRA